MIPACLLLLGPAQPVWVPTFVQDFDGPAGSPPDPKVWARDLGGGGFGNNEWQSYTDGAKNAFLDGKGNLIIEARKEPTKGPDGIARDYSSARLLTKGKFSQAYGRFEARMKLPKGKGIWPAFWMMGDSIDKKGWPGCGEIDIMEFLGHETKTLYGTLHGPGYSGGSGLQARFDSKTNLNESFHTYGVIWTPEAIKWTIDGKVYGTSTPETAGARKWVFDDPFFLILNLAVGGNWPGYPDSTTQFPQRLVVDYIRVYKDKNLKVDRKAIEARHAARMKRLTAFKGAPLFKLPGTITLADYRVGGYKDSDNVNEGGSYRPQDGVDIGGSRKNGEEYSIGWTNPGEWLEYDVNVTKAGAFNVSIEVSCEGKGGTIRLEQKGRALTKPVQIPDTTSWQKWLVIHLGRITLPKGKQRLRLSFVSASPEGRVGNVKRLFVRQ